MFTLFRPSVGNITQPFRSESGGPNKPIHLAVDFGHGNGRQVYAANPGVLTYDTSVGYGLRASISHPDGSFTRYAHLASGGSPRRVERGEQIGVMGDSGNLPKGVHLHFEWIVRGVKTNPAPYFSLENRVPPEEEQKEEPDMAVRELFLQNTSTNPNEIWWEREPGAAIYKLSQAEYAFLGNPGALSLNQAQITAWIATNGQAATIANAHAGTASGGLTAAQNSALMGLPAAIDNMPTNGELSGVITNQYNLLRTGATNDKNEILTAIDEIPGGSAPQNLTVTLTGTAEAAQ